MGPRLVGRGKLASMIVQPRYIELQWGRVLWDAESTLLPSILMRACVLQWGRVLWDAERISIITGCTKAKQLQWGRVLWDAESRPLVLE